LIPVIVDRKFFSYKGKCILEKLVIKPPFRLGVVFPNEACYLYLREGGMDVIAAAQSMRVIPKESILLNCGNYFADFLEDQKKAHVEIFAVHLHPEILIDIFRNELPSVLKPSVMARSPEKVLSQPVMDKFIDGLMLYFENPEIVNDEIVMLKLKELILLLAQTKNGSTVHTLISKLFTKTNISLSSIIQAHLYSNVSVEELAVLCGMSLSAFKRAFKKMYHETPARYIKRKKLV
jgi:AraC family transcriptional regulator, exoenzyme S synthesis regulatory protein ExsA